MRFIIDNLHLKVLVGLGEELAEMLGQEDTTAAREAA